VNAIRWSVAALAAGLATTVAMAAPAGEAAQIGTGHVQSRASGSNDPRLARFYAQHGARCADIRVPLDYAHPGGRVITIAISRLAAVPSAKKIGPMIINLGGPATPVLADVVLAREAMGATGARFDLIGMDQRFSGRGPSSRLCTTASSTWAARRAR
jgi:hypothetical protein